MPSTSLQPIPLAYAEHEQRIALGRIRIGCLLGMILLPLGSVVDMFLFTPQQTLRFLFIRSLGSLAMLPLMLYVSRPAGARHHRKLGVVLAMIPAASMAAIIHQAGGADSPYYAALNLVLLAIGLVLQWDFRQSIAAVLLMVVMYVLATWQTVPAHAGVFVNNLWFLLLTGVIVVTGNHIQSRLRFREYESRRQLEVSRRELELGNQRLRELDELKGRFFANISHELRTPLTVILGHLEAAQQQAAGAAPELRERLEGMHANGMRLLRLINDLLDLVRLDVGQLRLHLQPVEVKGFLRGLLNSVARFAEDRGLRLRCEVQPELTQLRADPDKLEKVFLNLLFNSIKFTPAGGEVRVLARRDRTDAVFEVVDTGAGIAPEHLPHLFSRFWQADSSAQRKFQGAGIGLALVKELVQAHGGTVRVQSQLEVGTTMSVRLPLGIDAPVPETEAGAVPETVLPEPPPTRKSPAAVPANGSPAGNGQGQDAWLASLYRRAELHASITPLRETLRPWSPQSGSNKPRVLIADDEPDMLHFLWMQLKDDYQVVEAVDGEQAVALAKQFLPEVIVCDMMMPEKDGFAVTRELRQHHPTRAIPLLMLTARADEETKLRALAEGVSDFLAKPFSLAELRVRLKNLVDNGQLQRALSKQNQKLQATLEQLKETEIQLIQTEKLASLGRMSAGVIHEINNPLNFARTGLFALGAFRQQLPAEGRPEFEDTLTDIEEGIKRVSSIVSDLRIFTHPTGGELEEVDVALCVESALRFLSAEWKNKVNVSPEVPMGFMVRASRSKLIQVLVNLLQNSLDALRERADGVTEPPAIRIAADEQNGARMLRIWDNGPGIPEHHLAKIFDPFFTTKDVGKGTGLGLSIVYRLLQEFGARVSVRSEPGRFCEFTLAFPLPVADTQRRDE